MTIPPERSVVYRRPVGRIHKTLRLFLALFLSVTALTYDAEKASGGQVAKGVVGEGACAISGMSADQCQLIAIQKARSSVIEQAAGVKVVSSTLVRNNAVALKMFLEQGGGRK